MFIIMNLKPFQRDGKTNSQPPSPHLPQVPAPTPAVSGLAGFLPEFLACFGIVGVVSFVYLLKEYLSNTQNRKLLKDETPTGKPVFHECQEETRVFPSHLFPQRCSVTRGMWGALGEEVLSPRIFFI